MPRCVEWTFAVPTASPRRVRSARRPRVARTRPSIAVLRSSASSRLLSFAPSVRTSSPRTDRLGESLDEVECRLGDLLPAVVDGQRVAAVGHLLDLGDARVALLPLVGGVGDRPGNRVVLLPVEDQQRAPIGVLRVDLRLGPRVEVGVGHLGQGDPRPGHVVGIVKALRLVLIEGVRPAVLELVEGERDGAAPIPGVQQERSNPPEHGEGQRQDAAKHARVDGNRGCREPTAGEHLGEQSAGRVPHHGGLLLELADHVGRVVGNLLQRLLGEHVRVRPRPFNRFRIVWPVRRQRRVTGLLEQVRPVGPAARQQPQAVDEDDRSGAGGVCRLDLPALPLRNGPHAELLSIAVEGHPTLANRRRTPAGGEPQPARATAGPATTNTRTHRIPALWHTQPRPTKVPSRRLPRAYGRLPTRQVVTQDEPRRARRVIPQPPRPCTTSPRRPCHYRATSISPEGSPPDTHGQRASTRDLARSFRRRWWLRATRAASVEGLRFHDLRHTAATLALAAGANTRELMERMGHTSPVVALRYQHVMAGRDAAITAALDELVQAAANLPPERPAEGPSGTLVARTRRAKSSGPRRSVGERR